MSEQTTVFGIDLGTTYSCISYLDETGRPEVCHSLEGNSTTPSVVIMPMGEEEQAIVGVTAKQQAEYYPNQTFAFVKQKIGRVETLEYGPEGARKTTTPVEVSAEILKKLAQDAEAYCNKKVKDVVITVPAYFGENEKAATKEAGILAGLNVINIVEEPTAAAFFYGCQTDADETIMVFDLGGGTFDVTAMRLEGGKLTEITKEGNHQLGGFLWDKALMDYVLEKFREETGYDDVIPEDVAAELPFQCESEKMKLSSAPFAMIKVNVSRAFNKQIKITREEFEEITEGLLEQALELTREVISRVEQNGLKVDKILLVGGSTKMPQVRRALTEEFHIETIGNEPDEAVSKGAAIYAAWKLNDIVKHPETDGEQPEYALPGAGKVGQSEARNVTTDEAGGTSVTLVDENGEERDLYYILPPKAQSIIFIKVASKSVGIKVMNQRTRKMVIWNLILKDEVLPINHTIPIPLAEDNMDSVSIELYQSEAWDEELGCWMKEYEPDSGYGVQIGEGILSGLPAGLPAGTYVDININYSEHNSLLEVTGAYNGIPLDGKVEHEYSEGMEQKSI